LSSVRFLQLTTVPFLAPISCFKRSVCGAMQKLNLLMGMYPLNMFTTNSLPLLLSYISWVRLSGACSGSELTSESVNGRRIGLSQGTTQKNASSGIRTHDSSVRTVEDRTHRRPRGQWGNTSGISLFQLSLLEESPVQITVTFAILYNVLLFNVSSSYFRICR